MSVLGKDLFDFQRSHTNTKVEFGASGYWVEMIPEMQPYGTVLTEILNLDVTPFQKLLDRLNTAVHEKNYDDAPRAYMDMQKGFGSLPLYRLYLMDFRYFGDMKIEEFVGEEVREAFAKYVINEEREIPSFMQQQIKDIQLIQERYLVQRGDSNTYDFYETPQRATHTEKDDTASGYDFTADAFAAPQAVNNGTAEDREININITDKINSFGGEKQVSPTPSERRFEF